MYGLAVNLIVSVSGHPWIIDEILHPQIQIPNTCPGQFNVFDMFFND